MTVQDYLRDPCGALSIPYWKSKTVAIPPFMRIVHQRDWDKSLLVRYADVPYFRLRHDLKSISANEAGPYICKTAAPEDIPLLADLINRSYTDLSVTCEQLMQYTHTEVYAPDLWIIVYDAESAEPMGCGIADFDGQAREGVLEWIQVLPQYRRRGVGQVIVNELLRRMTDRADFATVSGKAESASRPEQLYRSCGFVGDDVWHILTKR